MVQTSRGSECARCTLVDDDDQICIDELVHPELTVIDYCTQYSGIDKETLDPVTTTLAQIQAMFLSVVDARDVLVGHSLDNDLRCLKIYHATCADTSLSYKHARGPGYKRSLRHLAKEFLGKTIQDGAHDSVVDAKTALDLLRLKVRHGPDFGAPSRNNTSRHFLATAAALPDTRVAFCGPDPKPYAKGNVSAIKSDDLSKHVAGGGWHLLVAHNSTEDAAVLARHLPNDAILIVVDQPNLDDLSALEKRKRACVDPRSASEWTDDLEASRLELLDRSMSASIAVFSNEDI